MVGIIETKIYIYIYTENTQKRKKKKVQRTGASTQKRGKKDNFFEK